VRITGAFAFGALRLLRAGYSPVPIRPGSKRPIIEAWDKLRKVPLSEFEIWRLVRENPLLGLGVAGGYNGLVPVDIDTDDDEIGDAVMDVLPRPLVAKAGQRGLTCFYRSAVPITACKFKTPTAMLVEILTSTQTVIPPTVHPDTSKPYIWLTKRTLFDTPVGELPAITPATIGEIAAVLARWLPQRKAHVTQAASSSSTTTSSPSRYTAYARGALAGEARRLQAMPKNSGRNQTLFAAVCRLGKWVHHQVLDARSFEAVLLAACNANGLVAEDGLKKVRATIASGLRHAQNDVLPALGGRW
jgi:hypothetical protein